MLSIYGGNAVHGPAAAGRATDRSGVLERGNHRATRRVAAELRRHIRTSCGREARHAAEGGRSPPPPRKATRKDPLESLETARCARRSRTPLTNSSGRRAPCPRPLSRTRVVPNRLWLRPDARGRLLPPRHRAAVRDAGQCPPAALQAPRSAGRDLPRFSTSDGAGDHPHRACRHRRPTLAREWLQAGSTPAVSKPPLHRPMSAPSRPGSPSRSDPSFRRRRRVRQRLRVGDATERLARPSPSSSLRISRRGRPGGSSFSTITTSRSRLLWRRSSAGS